MLYLGLPPSLLYLFVRRYLTYWIIIILIQRTYIYAHTITLQNTHKFINLLIHSFIHSYIRIYTLP
jgi:hypothetical protein